MTETLAFSAMETDGVLAGPVRRPANASRFDKGTIHEMSRNITNKIFVFVRVVSWIGCFHQANTQVKTPAPFVDWPFPTLKSSAKLSSSFPNFIC